MKIANVRTGNRTRRRPVCRTGERQYALGCVLFEMLTGEPPYGRSTETTRLQVLLKHALDPIPSVRQRMPAAAIPEAVDKLIARLLGKKPEERFASVAQLCQEFNKHWDRD